ncbi:pentapeptide repeat-containing protein [Thermococcus sp. JCM 11816]|uniref:pentapeptide repeat-containing protein n=1 Tax=Thermococcus sp. (strain JCM 11816 / KS-1) TaxID=1295125 RepID=UPI003466D1C4
MERRLERLIFEKPVDARGFVFPKRYISTFGFSCFKELVDFRFSTFEEYANFSRATFYKKCNFGKAIFKDYSRL